MPTALLLPGAGAAGIVQYAQIRAIDNAGIQVDYVAGTSAGCLNGSLYNQGELGLLREIWLRIRNRDVYTQTPLHYLNALKRPGYLADGSPLRRLLSKVVLKERMKPRPFLINATDEVTRQPVQRYAADLTQEDLVTLCYASASVPVIFAPVAWQGTLLTDGGITNNSSIREAVSWGADHIILCLPRYTAPSQPGNLLDRVGTVIGALMENSLMREIKLVQAYNHLPGKREVQITLLRPRSYTNIGILDFDGLGSTADRMAFMDHHYLETVEQLRLLGLL